MSEAPSAETEDVAAAAAAADGPAAEATATAENDPSPEDIARAITREEGTELHALVTAERNGEDVVYAAFRSLCPTGEEFAFDDKSCAVYRLLHKRGLIDGADAEGGFLFFEVTPLGRAVSEAWDGQNRPVKASEGKPAKERLAGVARGIDIRTAAVSAGVAAIVGFLAGMLGSFVAGLF